MSARDSEGGLISCLQLLLFQENAMGKSPEEYCYIRAYFISSPRLLPEILGGTILCLCMQASDFVCRVQVSPNQAYTAPLPPYAVSKMRPLLCKQGYLYKLSGKSGKSWKRRWFSLENMYLGYREKPDVRATFATMILLSFFVDPNICLLPECLD